MLRRRSLLSWSLTSIPLPLSEPDADHRALLLDLDRSQSRLDPSGRGLVGPP
jgi:hypothetical protein